MLLYTLVYGSMPFDGRDFNRMIRQIKRGAYYEPENPSSWLLGIFFMKYNLFIVTNRSRLMNLYLIYFHSGN